MFDGTVTLFNKYEDKKRRICEWHSKVLDGVELQKNRCVSTSKNGDQSANVTSLHIPFTVCDVGLKVSGGMYQYLKPKEWYRAEDKRNSLTLGIGDFFVEGTLDIGMFKEADYPAGLLSHIKSEYDDVCIIIGVDTFHTIPHFEVSGS